MPGDLPFVSIIIPHWNGIDVLKECLESLKQSTYSSLEIIVVDNASTDGSGDWISMHYPEVILITNKKNLGYAGGCNRGAAVAKGIYLLFLNNDTVQDHRWLEPLVEWMEEHPNAGAVQPKILNYFQRDQFDYAGGAGGELDVLGFPFARGRIFLNREKDTGQHNQAKPVFWASGTCLMVRKTAFNQAGGFDETFFAHMEEIDLCWRFHLLKREVWAVPESVVFHKNAVSLPMFSQRKQYLNHRNSLFMLLSNYGWPLALYLFPLRYGLEWAAVLYALLKGDFNHLGGIIQAHLWLLFHPHVIWRKRRMVQALREAPDQEILKHMFKGSIVLNYYLKGQKRYSDLNREI